MQLLSDYETINTDDRSGHSILKQLSTGSEIAVPGLVLEAAYETPGENRLLWLTDDCPFEEGLHVLLLDRMGQVLDALDSKTIYTPGILDIRTVASDHVDFTFFDKACLYRLSVGTTARLRFELPRGWAYPGFRILHRMALTRLSSADDQEFAGGSQQT